MIQEDQSITRLRPKISLLGQGVKQLFKCTPISSMLNFQNFTIKVNELLVNFDQPVSIFMVNFDRFQQINEIDGHDVGEQLLEKVAERLLTLTSKHCLWANYWGNNFFLAVPDIADEVKLRELAQAILQACRQPWIVNNKYFFLTMNIGIAVCPDHGVCAAQLMKNADLALAQTQERGCNTYQVYHTFFSTAVTKNFRIEAALRGAWGGAVTEFYLVYQPRIHLQSGEINSFEALIRWNNQQWGEISPGQFIPVAETCGLISKIDQWVIISACKQIKEWRGRGENISISVNLSASELYSEQLLPFIMQTLHEFQVHPGQLEIEITETMIMRNIDAAIVILKELRSIGIQISLDDFGTGYSSLTNLKRLPIDTLKIDQSFLQDIDHSDESKSIVQMIITLGHILNLKVTAEGVETYSQFDLIECHDCDEVQGYHFSKPLLPEDAYEIFVNGNAEIKKLKDRLMMDSSCL